MRILFIKGTLTNIQEWKDYAKSALKDWCIAFEEARKQVLHGAIQVAEMKVEGKSCNGFPKRHHTEKTVVATPHLEMVAQCLFEFGRWRTCMLSKLFDERLLLTGLSG